MHVTVGETDYVSYYDVLMPPIARGQTWLCQPLPVSNVPNTGRSLTVYRGLDEDCAVKIVRRRKYGKIERERERERERDIDRGGMSKSTGRSERVESG